MNYRVKWTLAFVRISLCVGLSLGPNTKIYSQEIQVKMEAYLDSMVRAHNIPGISIGLLVGDEVVWKGASGYAILEEQKKATPETLFRIGSISKVLTATAAMRLYEQNQLDLEATVQDYLPDYPVAKKGTIKVRHLLHHTSGMDHYKGKENRTFTNYPTLRDATKLFESRKLKFDPGTKYSYTSYGYTLLGAIIEKIAKKDFSDLMNELVFRPANMQMTFMEDRKNQASLANLYAKKGEEIIPDEENDLSLIYPAGGMVSTAEDLLKFMVAWNDGKLVSEEVKKMMLSAPVYEGDVLDEFGGIGWNFWTHNKHGLVYHRIGGQSGCSALLLSYADAGVTVALLSNQAVLDPIWEIANSFIGFGLEYKQ